MPNRVPPDGISGKMLDCGGVVIVFFEEVLWNGQIDTKTDNYHLATLFDQNPGYFFPLEQHIIGPFESWLDGNKGGNGFTYSQSRPEREPDWPLELWWRKKQ